MNLLLIVGICVFVLIVGAVLGRYYAPDKRPLERAAREGRSYAQGLVELAEGDSDAAIDAISATLKKNTKTVEAYFALGTLFRQRGEYERAVRVHQAILVRRDLDKPTRLKVHHQLALDFKDAGFPKRAVKALEYIVAKDRKRVATYRELVKLYEETRQWEHAAAAYKRIGKLSDDDTGSLQAHMLAELAAEEIAAGELKGARKHLRRALSASEASVHALHVLGVYQLEKDNKSAAARVWEQALRRSPELASFFVPRLENVLFDLGKLEQLEKLLAELLKEHEGNVHLRLALARFDARRNPTRALAALMALLDDAPTLMPARKEAARLVLASGDPELIRKAFEDQVALLARADRGFRCGACGHTAEAIFWCCSKCRTWDSVGVAWGRRRGEGSGQARVDRLRRAEGLA